MVEYLLCVLAVQFHTQIMQAGEGKSVPEENFWPLVKLTLVTAFLLWLVLKVAIWVISGIWNWIDFEAIFRTILALVMAIFAGAGNGS